MKCPERFCIMQQNFRKSLIDTDLIIRGELSIFVENQDFKECYKEQCAAWNIEENKCRKVGN